MRIESPEVIQIEPQPRQEIFLSSPADIAIYGGAAGGGKTWALLLDPLRYIDEPGFGAVIFRRTITEITKEGGMWDEAGEIYPLLDARPNQTEHFYRFPSGSRITFAHLQYESNLDDWKGAQIPLLEFDQLETFTQKQFFYMLSRNRSTSKVIPYVRATCNPEPGWLADFLAWWIDEEGFAILERSGKIRWMVRENDVIFWADDPRELKRDHPASIPKSVTFIVSTIYDNKILMQRDPAYLANLQAMDYVDRQRLLGDPVRGGNWKVKPAAGKLFNRAWFEILDAFPPIKRWVRFWDLAATTKKLDVRGHDPDFTSSVKMAVYNKIVYIADCTNEQIDPARTDSNMLNLAVQDGKETAVRWEEEPGASGKRDSYHLVTLLHGYDARGVPSMGDKIMRAKPLAAQAYAGNVKLLRGSWNDEFLIQLHGQPELPHDDIMDGASGAYTVLTDKKQIGAWPL